jgi:hydrogenase maturation protease
MAPIGRGSIVIGVGNPDRGDDAAGRRVAELLRGALPAGVAIEEDDGEASSLVARLGGATTAFLIDACASGATPGTVSRFDVGAGPLSHSAFAVSTHGVGLAAAIELARALRQLPQRCVVYAIEGASFELGAPLSSPVARAVARTAAFVRHEITERIVDDIRGLADRRMSTPDW